MVNGDTAGRPAAHMVINGRHFLHNLYFHAIPAGPDLGFSGPGKLSRLLVDLAIYYI